MAYNPAEHHLHQLAKIMKNEVEGDVKNLEDKLVRETERKHAHGSTCKMCAGEVCNLCGEEVPEVRGRGARLPRLVLAAHQAKHYLLRVQGRRQHLVPSLLQLPAPGHSREP